MSFDDITDIDEPSWPQLDTEEPLWVTVRRNHDYVTVKNGIMSRRIDLIESAMRNLQEQQRIVEQRVCCWFCW